MVSSDGSPSGSPGCSRRPYLERLPGRDRVLELLVADGGRLALTTAFDGGPLLGLLQVVDWLEVLGIHDQVRCGRGSGVGGGFFYNVDGGGGL